MIMVGTTKEYAAAVLADEKDTRPVYMFVGDEAPVEIKEMPEDTTDCKFAVKALVQNDTLNEYAKLRSELEALEAKIDSIKEDFLTDAEAYNFRDKYEVYNVCNGPYIMSTTERRTVQVLSPEALKEKLGVLAENLVEETTQYNISSAYKRRIAKHLNGLELCTVEQYLETLFADRLDMVAKVKPKLKKTVRSNMKLFESMLNVPSYEAERIANNIDRCMLCEELIALAGVSDGKITADDLVDLLDKHTFVSVTTSVAFSETE